MRKTAVFLDRFHADRSVRSASRKEDPDDVGMHLSQRAKKLIDRRPLAPGFGKILQRQLVVGRDETLVRGDDVNVVAFDRDQVGDLRNRHFCVRLQHLGAARFHARGRGA